MRSATSLLIVCLVAVLTYARPVRIWTQQELFDESDFVAIVTTDRPVAVPNTHEFVSQREHLNDYLQQHESRLTVHSVLKGDRKPTEVTLIHFLKRKSVKFGMGNGPSYVWMGTESLAPKHRSSDQKPMYLVYLRARSDGKFDPVTGQMAPPDSVVRMIPFPERDPAMDSNIEKPEP